VGQAVQFVYACWDRIVLNGYLERLQRPGYLVHFSMTWSCRLHRASRPRAAVGDVLALQVAADHLSASLLERRCNYFVRRVVPIFSPVEREALRPHYRSSVTQMALATDAIGSSALLQALRFWFDERTAEYAGPSDDEYITRDRPPEWSAG
jgi:hypothetical protein